MNTNMVLYVAPEDKEAFASLVRQKRVDEPKVTTATVFHDMLVVYTKSIKREK